MQLRNLTPPSLETPQRVGAWPSSNKTNTDKDPHKPNNPKASSFQEQEQMGSLQSFKPIKLEKKKKKEKKRPPTPQCYTTTKDTDF